MTYCSYAGAIIKIKKLVLPGCTSHPSLEKSWSSMKLIGVSGKVNSVFDEWLRLVTMACCACDAWRLQVSQVSAADLLISSCHKNIIFHILILLFLLLVMLYGSCLWMVSSDDIIFALIIRGVFGVLFFHLGFVHPEKCVTQGFSWRGIMSFSRDAG